jgi:hypothetical protein
MGTVCESWQGVDAGERERDGHCVCVPWVVNTMDLRVSSRRAIVRLKLPVSYLSYRRKCTRTPAVHAWTRTCTRKCTRNAHAHAHAQHVPLSFVRRAHEGRARETGTVCVCVPSGRVHVYSVDCRGERHLLDTAQMSAAPTVSDEISTRQ